MVTPRPQKKVLSDLKASILNPALTSHFQCWFYPPSAVRSLLPTGEVQDDRMWSLSCAEAALPGTSLATNEMINDYTGVTERHAYRRQYDTTSSFTFYVDQDYKIINFFEKWIGYIVGENETNTDVLNDNKDITPLSGNYFYRVNFPRFMELKIRICYTDVAILSAKSELNRVESLLASYPSPRLLLSTRECLT